jgi:hypothetical protein
MPCCSRQNIPASVSLRSGRWLWTFQAELSKSNTKCQAISRADTASRDENLLRQSRDLPSITTSARLAVSHLIVSTSLFLLHQQRTFVILCHDWTVGRYSADVEDRSNNLRSIVEKCPSLRSSEDSGKVWLWTFLFPLAWRPVCHLSYSLVDCG